MTRRSTLVLMSVALVFSLLTGAAAGAGKGRTSKGHGLTVAQLRSRLLTISDMPSGWTVQPPSAGSGGGFACLANLTGPKANPVSASFQEGNFPQFEESLRSGQHKDFVGITNALSSCRNETFQSQGTTYTGQFEALSMPRMAAESKAYEVTFNVQGFNVAIEINVFRAGSTLGLTTLADFGQAETQLFNQLTQSVVNRLGVPAGRQSGGTSQQAAAPTISPDLTGTAQPIIPPAKTGRVSVVSVGAVQPESGDTVVPVIVRNGTSGTISNIQVSGPALNPQGQVIGSGQSGHVAPENLLPGQVSFVPVSFQSTVPTGSDFHFSVTYDPESNSSRLDAKVTQANLITGSGGESSIVGEVINPGPSSITGPISVTVFCFDSSGHLIAAQSDFTAGSGNIAPGASDSYQVTLLDQSCPTYLVGSSGWVTRG